MRGGGCKRYLETGILAAASTKSPEKKKESCVEISF